MSGYDYERGDEGRGRGTRWKHGKKGIVKEVWQRKNWSCGKGEGKEKRRNKGSTGREGEGNKGEWDTKGYKGRGVGKSIKKYGWGKVW